MWFITALAGLMVAIAGHAAVRRLAPSFNSLAAFILVGGAVGVAVTTIALLVWGAAAESWAVAVAYAFACELYIFFFSIITGSISASLLYQLRTKTLSPYECRGPIWRQGYGRASFGKDGAQSAFWTRRATAVTTTPSEAPSSCGSTVT